MPTHQEELLSLFNSFLSNTSKLGAGGLALFAVTSVFLLDTITGAFNSLWGSRSKRNLSSKFTTYISLIVVGSLLISLGISVSGQLRGIFPGGSFDQLGALRKLPIRLIPAAFTLCFLFLLYKTIPASYVQTRSALLGAVWGAFFTEVTRYWFLQIANTFIRMSIIYGSLAVIPIFLFWLYVLWLFTLLGLEIAYANQFHVRFTDKRRLKGSSLRSRLATGIELYLTIAEGYGKKMFTEKRLIKKFRISPEALKEYLDKFLQAGVLLEVHTSKPFASTGWAPGAPLEHIQIRQLFEIILGTEASSSPIVEDFLAQGYLGMNGLCVADVLAERAKTKT